MIAPKKIFGTDGVRGRANIEPVTAETVLKLGRAAGHFFKNLETQSRGRGRHRIVIGKDTRLSGYMLENAISSGILSMGVDVLFIGPLPTPGVAYVTRSLRADAGIVITASHNPYDDNGIKFFRADGYKLEDQIERAIEGLVFSGEIENIRPTADAHRGKATRIDDALGRYIRICQGLLSARADAGRDARGGGLRPRGRPTSQPSACCQRTRGRGDRLRQPAERNEHHINHECGSMHPEQMCRKVREHKAHIGIALDGDADRVLLCDEAGAMIDGDDVMAIAARDLLAQGGLAEKTVVTTVMSNAGLDTFVRGCGGKLVRTAVGDRNVIDEMLRHGYNFGGEQSGHMIFRDFGTTGDGMVCALQILRIMKTTDTPLSQLADCWTRYPQLVVNVRVREKRPFEELAGVLQLVAQAEAEVAPSGGRVLLRYSGTEPKARLLIEGRENAVLERHAQKIIDAIKRQVGE